MRALGHLHPSAPEGALGRESEAWNRVGRGLPLPEMGVAPAARRPWLGAARGRGLRAVRGRRRQPAPLPRAALSARQEAAAVGSFAGLCSGDFGGGEGGGGGASGTSVLVSSARPAGRSGANPAGGPVLAACAGSD